MSRVSTVIVTWNQTDLTLNCLAALVGAGVSPAAIWVVDNGSDSEALPRLRERQRANGRATVEQRFQIEQSLAAAVQRQNV